jgi:hypothetical protein
MSVIVEQAFLNAAATKAVEDAIKACAANNPAITSAVAQAINNSMITVAPMITVAVEKAVLEVTNKPDFLHTLIEKAILNGADKLGGSFDASLRAAGKGLAMDRETLEKVAAGVKAALRNEAEARIAEYELRGAGTFA